MVVVKSSDERKSLGPHGVAFGLSRVGEGTGMPFKREIAENHSGGRQWNHADKCVGGGAGSKGRRRRDGDFIESQSTR